MVSCRNVFLAVSIKKDRKKKIEIRKSKSQKINRNLFVHNLACARRDSEQSV